MATLKENIKLFITHQLACYNTPTEVADAVKEEFDIELPRSQVAFYDPTNSRGSELSAKFREYFHQKRKEFLDNIEAIPMANANVRVNELNKMYYEMRKRKNYVLAMQISEQIAKETGGFYTNKISLGNTNGLPFLTALQGFNGGSLPIVDEIEGEFTEVKEKKTNGDYIKNQKKKVTKSIIKADWSEK